MVRLLHTADWQLGLSRAFLPPEAQARYAAARFEAVRRLARLAREEDCAAILVAGDAFESNLVDRRTVERAFDALTPPEGPPVPVYLLPGNHDPLSPGSVYHRSDFRRACPGHVRVLEEPRPVTVRPGLEVVGMPWRSKRPLEDPVAALAAQLPPAASGVRVAVAHGAVDALAPGAAATPVAIRLDDARRALAEGRFHYLALGDRHSATRLDDRIAYAGTPEVTRFDEERPGWVLLVTVGEGGVEVEEHAVGRWSFRKLAFELAGEADLEGAEARLEELPAKTETALRLRLGGQLSLARQARLEELLERARERFAALEVVGEGPTVVPDVVDEETLALSGFARRAFAELAAAAGEDPVARDALALLYRLVRG
jgi:DNA repair exonuclease SbcCD nuclease subunit